PSQPRTPAKAPRVQPSDPDNVPMKTVQIGADSSRTTRIAGNLEEKYEDALITFLRANVDVFTWEPAQMPGIPREVIEHHLRIYPDATPVRQKPQKQSVLWQNFIREEVRKMLHAGFIEEVHHPEWL